MRNDPDCERCGDTETMEHVLCECLHYYQLLWNQLGEIITRDLNSIAKNINNRRKKGKMSSSKNVNKYIYYLLMLDG
jgi:hypothetical protein